MLMKLIPVHRGKLYLTLLYKKGACKMLVKLTPVYHKNILLVFITNLHPENIKKMLRLPITKNPIHQAPIQLGLLFVNPLGT